MSDERDEPALERDDDELELEGAHATGVAFLAGLALGAVLGVGVALMVAPARGDVTRRRIRRRLREFRDDAAERIGDARDAAERELRRQRRRLRRNLPHR